MQFSVFIPSYFFSLRFPSQEYFLIFCPLAWTLLQCRRFILVYFVTLKLNSVAQQVIMSQGLLCQSICSGLTLRGTASVELPSLLSPHFIYPLKEWNTEWILPNPAFKTWTCGLVGYAHYPSTTGPHFATLIQRIIEKELICKKKICKHAKKSCGNVIENK